MPYISKHDRHELDTGRLAIKPGELNYLLTREVQKYINTRGDTYTVYNDVLGALEGCKLELYRRKVAPYEDIKIKENGDVYE